MRKSIRVAAILVASWFAFSALAMAQAQQQDNTQHKSKLSKLAVWRHHKDSKDAKNTKMKSNGAAKAPAAQPQVAATAARPRPVKHISDMDDDTASKPVAKKANPKDSHVRMASSKAPAGKDNMKPAMHHAAQKSTEPVVAKKKAAQKKSAKPAAGKDKKPA